MFNQRHQSNRKPAPRADPPQGSQPNSRPNSRPNARLNVLLTQDRPHAIEHWTFQLPRLLEPQGVAAYVARSGQEAIKLAERVPIHAAAIDLGTPFGKNDLWSSRPSHAGTGPAGMWMMQLLRRLPYRLPVVLVRGPAMGPHQVDRLLSEALRLGAFCVVEKPVELEQMLTVFRRLLDRQYKGLWPRRPGSSN